VSAPAPAETRTRPVTTEAGSGFWSTVFALIATDVIAIASVSGLLSVMAAIFTSVPDWTVYQVGLLTAPLLMAAYGISGLYRVIDIHPAEELRQMSTITFIALVVPGCRVLGRILLARTEWWGVPVVVLGTGEHGKTVIDTLKRWPELGFRPAALLQDDHFDEHEGVPRPAGPEQAPNLANSHRVPYAIIAMPNLSYKDRSRMITHYGKFFRRLFVVPEGLGPAALWTARSSSQGLLGFGIKHFRLSRGARVIKRILDRVGATVGLILTTPLFLTIAALIKLDSRGPVFFRQERMGEEGRIFTVLKFRTMYTDAEAKLQEILESDPELKAQYERYHKLQEDPRVTRVGRWLRRMSLDELPQLWNILWGDMSLVGPRAYMPSELPKMNGLSRAVLQCPPGLTGLWQVSGRNNLDFNTRVDLDVHYMQNWTIWLDLYILIRTIPVVLSGDGAN